MKIKTYTDLWSMEKKLYSVYDLALPAPVSLRAVGIFIGISVPWMGLLALLTVPLSPFGLILYISVPTLVAWLGSKPFIEGKNLFQYGTSRFKFLFQSRIYNNLSPAQDDSDTIYDVQLAVWHKEK